MTCRNAICGVGGCVCVCGEGGGGSEVYNVCRFGMRCGHQCVCVWWGGGWGGVGKGVWEMLISS